MILHFLSGLEASSPEAGQLSQPRAGIGVGLRTRKLPAYTLVYEHQHFQAGLSLVPCSHLGLISQSTNAVH